MVSTCAAVVASLLLFNSMAPAQVGSQHPSILLKLPEGTDAAKVSIGYFMTGAFGGYGGGIEVKPNVETYTIDAAVGDSPAAGVKVIAWLPGCEMPAFDVKVQEQKIERSLECKPLGSVHFKGQLTPGRVLVPADKPVEITVDYLADWACRFFGTPDCMVPQFRVGAASMNDQGFFEISLPDLANQPGMTDGEFTFTLREKVTGNILAFLHPGQNGSVTHNLKVLHEYAPVVYFEAQELVPVVQ